MNVALAQLHPAPFDAAANASTIERLLTALGGRADLLILPEQYLSAYHLSDARLRAAALSLPPAAAFSADDAPPSQHPLLLLSRLARAHRTAVCVSFPEALGGALHITAAVLDRDGTLAAVHRKTQLWGERERRLFTPGAGPLAPFALSAFPGTPLGLLICFELEFPEPARVLALRGARALICVAASAEAANFTSERVAPVRAAENGVALVWVNHPPSAPPPDGAGCGGADGGAAAALAPAPYSGGSGAWGPDGAALHAAGGPWVDEAASAAATSAAAAPSAGNAVRVLRVDVDAPAFTAYRARNPYLAERRVDLFQHLLL